MKSLIHPKKLPLFAACAGLTVMVLRFALFLLGRDEKNLLITGHPLDILVWIVTAAAVLLILGSAENPKDPSRYSDPLVPSSLAAVGTFALAGGILVSVLTGSSSGLRLEMLCRLIGALAVPAAVWAGLCRYQGKKPFLLAHGTVCLYLILYTVSHYQAWSSRPQIQDWLFSMAGIVCLDLFAYQQTAFDADLGKHRIQRITGLLTGIFCFGAIAGAEDLLLYIGGGIWALTNLCRPAPVRRRRNPITEKDIPDETA